MRASVGSVFTSHEAEVAVGVLDHASVTRVLVAAHLVARNHSTCLPLKLALTALGTVARRIRCVEEVTLEATAVLVVLAHAGHATRVTVRAPRSLLVLVTTLDLVGVLVAVRTVGTRLATRRRMTETALLVDAVLAEAAGLGTLLGVEQLTLVISAAITDGTGVGARHAMRERTVLVGTHTQRTILRRHPRLLLAVVLVILEATEAHGLLWLVRLATSTGCSAGCSTLSTGRARLSTCSLGLRSNDRRLRSLLTIRTTPSSLPRRNEDLRQQDRGIRLVIQDTGDDAVHDIGN